jgi:hypothetical protein
VIFDDTDRALMHICFVDKVASISVQTKKEQYDFDISEELLVGLFAMYQEHCKRVDNKEYEEYE